NTQMSSPRRITSWSRHISSRSACEIASRYVMTAIVVSVREQPPRDGLGAGIWQRGRLVYRALHRRRAFIVNFREIGLAPAAVAGQVFRQQPKRVAPFPELAQISRDIPHVVVLAVAAASKGLELDERRSFAASGAIDGRRDEAAHLEDVVSEADRAGNVERRRAVGDVLHRHLLFDRRRVRIAVVLDDDHHGQLVDGGEAEPLVEVARTGGAIARERDVNARLLAVLERERETCTGRN